MTLASVLPAIGLGIAYAAAPGAVNTEAIRRGAAYGTRSTLLVETGSLKISSGYYIHQEIF